MPALGGPARSPRSSPSRTGRTRPSKSARAGVCRRHRRFEPPGARGLHLRRIWTLRLRLLQPVPHVHLAVHRRRGEQLLPDLLGFARAPIEFAEAVVTMGNERAHTELRGECQGLLVVVFGFLRFGGVAARSDLAQKEQGPCFVAAFAVLAGEREGLASSTRAE